ncbi:hypothetical protein B0H10DRAFT_1424380 [Mycena sp. CBHHK59/15]|nr:hypothetical protein B0H10DRAFT_1424380 [Mycena sp. CBHHK59/15]
MCVGLAGTLYHRRDGASSNSVVDHVSTTCGPQEFYPGIGYLRHQLSSLYPPLVATGGERLLIEIVESIAVVGVIYRFRHGRRLGSIGKRVV